MYSSVGLLLVAASWMAVSADEFRLVVNNRLRRGQDDVTDNQDFDALTFLERTGYLDNVLNTTRRHHAPRNVRQALREFQQHVGISVTGRLDKATLDVMKRPRCGVPDVVKPSQRLDENVPENYSLGPSDWPKNDLTYKWTRISERMMDREDIRRVVREAFEKWSRVTPLNFRETTGSADIDLLFVGKNDPEPCGRDSEEGGMIAHSFYRLKSERQAGNIHFDDAEPWAENNQLKPPRLSLKHVALHEIGHSLGLGHSDDSNAVMVPWYNGMATELTEDDIKGIQKLYGSREDGSLTPVKNICSLRFDAIDHGVGGDIFAFAGQYYYLITQNGLGKKRKIADWFKGAPNTLDAVLFDRLSDRIYFFKDEYYYRFNNYELDEDMPKLLPEEFHNIDAALMSNQDFYLIKGDKITIWEDLMQRPPYGYPKSISSIYGNDAPHTIDAAINYNNEVTFFFKDDKYWKFVDYRGHEQSSPGYPKSILPFWLHCGFVEGRDEEPIFGYIG